MKARYWDRNKIKMFPEIKDWTDPQDKRKKGYIHQQSQKEWFWFNKEAYLFYHYGTNVISTLIFTLFAVYFCIKGVWFGAILMFLFGGYFLYHLIKKIRNKDTIKDMTFFDLYLREY